MIVKRIKIYFGIKFIRAERSNPCIGYWCCMNSEICKLWSDSEGHTFCNRYKLLEKIKLYKACCIVNHKTSYYVYIPNAKKKYLSL